MIRILIGGDVYPAGNIQPAFVEGRAPDIFHDLLPEIETADLSIVNLECPLISKETPIAKAGPVLGAPRECIRGFAEAGWNVLNLANNHSFDHGAEGLRETIRTIREAGLEPLGAGENIAEAQQPFVREIEGQRIVVYSMAEREFSVAAEDFPGANPLDLINVVYAIREHKRNGVFIVLIHGGNEYYPYPSPEMVRRCRFMIDMGAGAVVCCHAHCPLPWEIYAGCPIVYGLGNLVFESTMPTDGAWYQGYMAGLTLTHGRLEFAPVPYEQSRHSVGTGRMAEDREHAFINELSRRSDETTDASLLKNRWLEHCAENRDSYLAMLFGHRSSMLRLLSHIPLAGRSRKAVRQALLLVQCEAHHEVLTSLFSDVRRTR